MKTWLVTGASRGFGRTWADAALARGDAVAATARDTSALAGLAERHPADRLLALPVDVTDAASVGRAVAAAAERFGRIDVAVNNAGYGLFGTVEEVSLAQVRAQLETNFLGALAVTQAVLPVMRAQGGGRILQVSSIGGVLASPGLGIYQASKWALEAMSQALAAEAAAFGVRVTILEPGPFATDWSGSSAVRAAELPEYAHLRAAPRPPREVGDPAETVDAVLGVVDSDDPPLRLLLGEGLLGLVEGEYERRLATWRAGAP